MSILDFIQKLFGKEDVSSMEYRQITDETVREQLEFTGVRGSVRLLARKIKLPSETNKEIDDFLATPVP